MQPWRESICEQNHGAPAASSALLFWLALGQHLLFSPNQNHGQDNEISLQFPLSKPCISITNISVYGAPFKTCTLSPNPCPLQAFETASGLEDSQRPQAGRFVFSFVYRNNKTSSHTPKPLTLSQSSSKG